MIKYIARTSTCLFLLIILSVIALNETSLAIGTIEIEKVTIPVGGVGFDFTSDIPTGANFMLDDGDANAFIGIAAGTYVVTEVDPTSIGYGLTDIDCTCPVASTCTEDVPNKEVTIVLANDDIVTCVFTNTGNGTIIIEKETVPVSGIDFGFTTNIPGPGNDNFMLDDGGSKTILSIPAGTYLVTEDNPTLSGYGLTLIDCICPVTSTCTEDIPNRNATITLADGDTASCVFANTGNGTIIIEKETIPVGGVGFGFTTDIPGFPNFILNDGESEIIVNIPAGTYMVTEGNPAISPGGFVLSDIVCDDMGSSTDVVTRTATIDLDPNETITCKFTNTLSLEGLNILKTDMPDPVVAGQELTYQILIENGSNIQATMMMLSDFLPMGVIPVSVSANRSDVDCDFFADPLEAVCDIGNLSSGEAVIITIIVIPDPDEFNEGLTIIENIATLTAEPGSVIREDMTQTLVNPIVMIDVENTRGSSTTVKNNRDFPLKYNVTNNANEVPEEVLATINQQSLTPEQRANALGVIFNLSFSSLFEVNSVETSKGIACIVAPGSIECPLGNINEGQTETVTINFRAPQEKNTYDFDSIVTSLLQEFENNFRVRVEGDNNNCSIAPVGASPSVPLYLFIPLFIVIRRFWRRVSK